MNRILSILLSAVMVISVCTISAVASEEKEEYTVPTTYNTDYNLNPDWEFSKPYGVTWPLNEAVAGTVDENGRKFYEPEFNSSAWENVSLPHTFNDEDSFRHVGADAGDAGVYRGISFYRKHFTVPKVHEGKKVIIEFEGVRQGAYVYINGEMVGYYEKGVNAFGMDLSNHIKYGEDNVLAVALDNTSTRNMTNFILETRPGSEPGSNDGEGFCWNCKDFNPVFGGLTRNVILHIKNNVYQTLPLYSNLRTKGVYVHADNINTVKREADITVESEVRNETDKDVTAVLEVNLVDSDNKLIKTYSSYPITIKAAEDKEKNYDLTILANDAYSENPAPTDTESLDSTVITASQKISDLNLWSPDSPYLYDVYTVLKIDGIAVDIEKTTTGFRKIDMKSGEDGGVYINDKYTWLTGYSQRSTNEWAAIGVAPDWLIDYDMQLLRESNANFIRWMHIAAQPAVVRSCDKYGIVQVMPACDKELEPQGRQWDQRVEVMRDTIIYYRNSPSVFFYEAGNHAISAEHMKEMTALRQTLDPKNQRTMGCRSIVEPETVAESEYVSTMLGRNVWNGKEFTEYGTSARDAKTVLEVEYHRDEAPRRIWDDFSPPDFDYRNKYNGGSKIVHEDSHDLTSEQLAYQDAKQYYEYYSQRTNSISANKYYSSAAALCWTDSAQHTRQQASENCRTSGRVDPVRIKKQSFFTYRVIQNTEPDIHIVGHWSYPSDKNAYKYEIRNDETYAYTGEYALRDAEHKTVYVMASNVDKVELFINGKSIAQNSEPKYGFIYEFADIDITENGYIEALGQDLSGNVLVRHKIQTALNPAAIELIPVTGPQGLRADGSDVMYIDVNVVDENGNICPLDYDRIDFDVTGPAEMLGGYNSGINDINHSNYYTYSECGQNRIFLRSTREAGKITVTAKRAGMLNVSVTVNSTAFETENGMTATLPQTREAGEYKETKATADIQPLKSLSGKFKMNYGFNTKIKAKTADNESHVAVFAGDTEIECNAYRMIGVYGEIEPVLKALDIKYTYDEASKTLTASYGENTIVTTVENSEMTVNGEPGIINDWPTIRNGKLLAEISAIIPNLGIGTYTDDAGYHIIKEAK